MTKDCQNRYKVSRANSGMTQESAASVLSVSPRTLSDYENGRAKVPDDIVATMSEVYKCPLLAWWHLRETSVLGKFLPDIQMPQTNGDMVFQLIIAQDDLAPRIDTIKQILSDGVICEHEQHDFDSAVQGLKQIKAKIMSSILYAKQISGADPDATGSTPISKSNCQQC